ncbi:MAG: DUF4860 domain-containing protein [Eubacteriales bacterium]|nr:DUF4860 domain-containing protein [Eubacteriales bacterium]
MEMKRSLPFSGRVRGLFTFALLCVYAVTACLLLLSGLQVYRGVKNRADANYDSRTALAYVSAKLRSGCAVSCSGENVLILTETIEKEAYNTYIFCRDGQLCEYFASAARAFDPSLGEPIANAASIRVTRDGARVDIQLTDAAGGTRAACFRERTTGEVTP